MRRGGTILFLMLLATGQAAASGGLPEMEPWQEHPAWSEEQTAAAAEQAAPLEAEAGQVHNSLDGAIVTEGDDQDPVPLQNVTSQGPVETGAAIVDATLADARRMTDQLLDHLEAPAQQAAGDAELAEPLATPPPPARPSEPIATTSTLAEAPVSPTAAVAVGALLGASGLVVVQATTMPSSVGNAATWLRRLLPIGAFFTRFQKQTVLQNDRREAIWHFLQEHPGASIQEVARFLDVGRTTVVHHVKLLEQQGLVASESRGRSRHLWATPDGHLPRERRPDVLMQQATLRRIVAYVEANPGACQAQISAGLDLTPSTVSRLAKRAQGAHVLRATRQGRQLLYTPGPALA